MANIEIEREHTRKEFGDFIRERRLQRDMYQREVAEMVGVSQSYYSLVENGEREVDLVLAMKICSALRLDLSKFISKYK